MTKIIAEVCQNHNGSRQRLGEMIKAAAESGADMIKMQSIWSTDVTKRERFEDGQVDTSGKQIAIKRPYDAEVERLSKLDLSLDDHQFFIDECTKYGVLPLTAIFARHRIPGVGTLPWPDKWIKVPSYDCASYPMLKELAKYFDNFIISTGATYDEEIEKTAELMKKFGKRFVFLHCVTSYPNTLEMCNLSRMEWLRQFTPEVGWSDHTKIEDNNIIAAKAAIYLGADYVERHFTILPPAETKDGPVSMTPELLKDLVRFRALGKNEQNAELMKLKPDWEIMLGNKTREMTDTELLNRDYYRGRFASPDGKRGWIYNWEEKPLQ
ncbi:MAG: N-acetylneuraminate synthase family protein [bacterium]|nr:N-acetylneuraminate synthase family protein [bacterium]